MRLVFHYVVISSFKFNNLNVAIETKCEQGPDTSSLCASDALTLPH